MPWENIQCDIKKKTDIILGIKKTFYKENKHLKVENRYISDMLVYLDSLSYHANQNIYLMEIYINNILETT